MLVTPIPEDDVFVVIYLYISSKKITSSFRSSFQLKDHISVTWQCYSYARDLKNSSGYSWDRRGKVGVTWSADGMGSCDQDRWNAAKRRRDISPCAGGAEESMGGSMGGSVGGSVGGGMGVGGQGAQYSGSLDVAAISAQAGTDASSETNWDKMSVDFLTDDAASTLFHDEDESSEQAGTGTDMDIDRLIAFDQWKEEYLNFRKGASEEMKDKIHLHADGIKYFLWGCVDDVEIVISEHRTTESFSLSDLCQLVYHLSESVGMLGKESCLCDLLKKTQKAYHTIEWDENARIQSFNRLSAKVSDVLKKIQAEKESGTFVDRRSHIKDMKRSQAKRQREDEGSSRRDASKSGARRDPEEPALSPWSRTVCAKGGRAAGGSGEEASRR